MIHRDTHYLSARVSAGFAAAMGIGRFVYTPILPIMTTALMLPVTWTSWIAAANYLGYLLGAMLLARRATWITTALLRGSLCLTIIALLAMPFFHALIWFCWIRFVSGVASAFAFVCLAHSAIDIEQRGGESGLAYSGVGAGICLSGLLVAVMGHMSWQVLWYLSAGLAMLLSLAAWGIHIQVKPTKPVAAIDLSFKAPRVECQAIARRALVGSYFLEGIGYIIIGTYLVAVVRETTTSGIASWVWVVAGIAAMPSPILWRRLRLRFGARMTFVSVYVLQLCAALLPFLSGRASAAFVAAALFGVTFMGITQLTISEAHELQIHGAVARLTTSYGIGQILGPIAVSPLLASSFHHAFLLAVVVLIACVIWSFLLPSQR